MTPAEAHLRRRIALEGPLTLADFMANALGHPKHGYYMTRDPFGRSGDFTTAPEISQMFGELIGLWCAETWARMNRPAKVHLVELGPGRGALMVDLLRAARRMPGFLKAVVPNLIETSPVLRMAQARALADGTLADDLPPPAWHDDIAALPDDASLLIIGNEFFDALPIRQIQKTEEGWRERLLAVDPSTGRLALTLSRGAGPLEAMVDPALRARAKTGRVVELAPLAWRIAGDMGTRLKAQGGAGLIIDYGYEGPVTGNTLQAVKAHEPCPILETPGEADLTAHVDFTALGRAAAEGGARVSPVRTQGDFLRDLGIEFRAKTLMQAAPGPAARQIEIALDRLIGADGMGTLFKVMGLAGPEISPLPGLEAE